MIFIWLTIIKKSMSIPLLTGKTKNRTKSNFITNHGIWVINAFNSEGDHRCSLAYHRAIKIPIKNKTTMILISLATIKSTI
jgi:hypothetical protein